MVVAGVPAALSQRAPSEVGLANAHSLLRLDSWRLPAPGGIPGRAGSEVFIDTEKISGPNVEPQLQTSLSYAPSEGPDALPSSDPFLNGDDKLFAVRAQRPRPLIRILPARCRHCKCHCIGPFVTTPLSPRPAQQLQRGPSEATAPSTSAPARQPVRAGASRAAARRFDLSREVPTQPTAALTLWAHARRTTAPASASCHHPRRMSGCVLSNRQICAWAVRRTAFRCWRH